jgi:hypothetical protein
VLRQQQVLARLAREFHVPEEHLRARLAELRTSKRSRRSDPPAAAGSNPPIFPSKIPAWERELLELLLTAPETIQPLAAEIFPGDLEHPLAREIYQNCLDLEGAGRPIALQPLLDRCEDVPRKSLLIQLDEEGRAKRQSDLAQRTKDLVRAVRGRREKVQLARQLASFKDGTLPQEQEVEALSKFLQMKSRQAGSAPTEG